MKKRIRKTGEIVDVIDYHCATSVKPCDVDWVSYIDSFGVVHQCECDLNIYRDFEGVEYQLPAGIDWEQRRYEIAKDMMAVAERHNNETTGFKSPKQQAQYAIECADAIMAELKKRKCDGKTTE